MSNSNALSAAETAVYDRQLRVWGAEAQGRLKSSRVLVAGAGALGAEVAKNLALAGVAVTLADGAAVTLADVGSSYLLGADDVGANRATASLPRLRELNPFVQASVLPLPAGALADAQLEPFALLVAAGGPLGAHAALAAAGRRLGRPVLAATAAGYWGFLFSDAGARHEFDPVVAAARAGEGASGGGGAPAPPRARAVVAGAPLADVLAAPWTPAAPSVKATRPAAFAYVAALAAAAAGAGGGGAPPPPPYPAAGAIAAAARARADAGGAPHAGRVDDAAIGALADGLGKELAPVVAVLGGVVGDEAVKLLTRRDEPLHNVFVFDAMGGTGGNWNTFGSPAPPATIASSPAQ